MAFPTRYFRHHNFLRDASNKIAFNNAKLDAEFNSLVETAQQLNDFIRGITNPDGTLRFTQALREMDLIEETRIVATGGQTALTVPSYDTATDRVRVFVNGTLLDPNSVTLTDATTVTIPARTNGDLVVVEVFSAGSGVLTKLISQAENLGAALVGIEDASGIYDATTVEDALMEVMTLLNGIVADAGGDFSGFIRANGTVPFSADIPANNNTLTGLRASAANGEAVRHEQLQAVITTLNATTSAFLAKAGGTMSGAINMASQRIQNLPTAAAGTDAVNKNEVTSMLASFGGLPVGSITAFGGATAPSGWVLCDGTAYDRTSATYVNLFNVIGTTYGTGSGGNDFQVPDLRGRAPIGSGTGTYSGTVTTRSRGDKGGRETVTLTLSQIPAHKHQIVTNNDDSASTGGPRLNKAGSNTGSWDTENAGGGSSHENMMPYNTVNFIIKY